MEFKNIHSEVKNSKWLALVAGFLGAAGPSLAVLYAMTQVPAEEFVWPHLNFFIGMLMIGFLGVFLVAITSERNAYKAILQGGGAPAFLNSAGTVAITVAMSISSMGILYAQEQIPQIEKLDSISLTINVENGDTLRMIAGNTIYKIYENQQIKIPAQRYITIEHEKSSRECYLPQKDSLLMKISVQRRTARKHFVSGLLAMQQTVTNKIASKLINVKIEEIRNQVQEQEQTNKKIP